MLPDGWSDYLLVLLLAIICIRMYSRYMAGGVYHGLETMAGKTVVITGGNDGIGKETVRELAMRGARIIMGNRNLGKGERVRQEISKQTNNDNIENRSLDLGSFESVRAFAKSVNQSESRIDVLINNAGVFMGQKRCVTESGFEMNFGINHLGHFLLTNLLLDKLKQSSPSRILTVSSQAYRDGALNFEDINCEQNYSMSTNRWGYSPSKVANVLHSFELSRRLKGTGVTANSIDPGIVRTGINRSIDFKSLNFIKPVVNSSFYIVFGKTARQGAQTTLRLALDSQLETVSGKHFTDCVEEKVRPHGRDTADAERLWSFSEDATKKQD